VRSGTGQLRALPGRLQWGARPPGRLKNHRQRAGQDRDGRGGLTLNLAVARGGEAVATRIAGLPARACHTRIARGGPQGRIRAAAGTTKTVVAGFSCDWGAPTERGVPAAAAANRAAQRASWSTSPARSRLNHHDGGAFKRGLRERLPPHSRRGRRRGSSRDTVAEPWAIASQPSAALHGTRFVRLAWFSRHFGRFT